jgi:DNA-directed RNA polymerase subunit M/transcription elongation factor TFIIS
MSKFVDYNVAYIRETDTFEGKLPKDVWSLPTMEKDQKAFRATVLLSTSKPKVEESRVYQCGRCKGRLISYLRVQLRRGDEAETIIFTCQSCFLEWKD